MTTENTQALAALAGELIEAINHYFEVYENKHKKPGWLGRVYQARAKINRLIAKQGATA